MENSAFESQVSSLTLDLLQWLAQSPRTYGETMDAWRSSCPRLTIWEDALADGLVTVENEDGSGVRRTMVLVTTDGRRELERNR